MSLARRQALVDEMEDELGMRWREEHAQRRRKRLSLFRLRTRGAVGMQRIANDDNFYLVLSDEAYDGFQVRAQRCAAQSKERLRGDAESIGDGDADATVTNVKRERAGMRHGYEGSK